MSANFVKLESLEALDRLVERSHNEPVVLFKHSSTCGISAGVHREVSDVAGDVNIVIVQTHRDISNKIAELTGIRHESPQAIILWAGKPVYHASHYDITGGDIEEWLKPRDSRSAVSA
jgi:thioredoxin 1